VENGAGKSTLMKIVGGLYQPDGGELRLGRRAALHLTPVSAVNRGIEVAAGCRSPRRSRRRRTHVLRPLPASTGGRVRWRELRRQAQALAERLGLTADLRRPAGSLSPAEQRLVMIARALVHDVQLLILDEPTVSLPEEEVDRLLGVIRTLRDGGVSVIYVSHRLEEIIISPDRVTVMRRAGRRHAPDAQLDKRTMMGLIVGRAIEDLPGTRRGDLRPAVAVRPRPVAPVRARVSFDLFPGEVLELAGLIGAGRTEVARMIFGADRRARRHDRARRPCGPDRQPRARRSGRAWRCSRRTGAIREG
jgi:ABC-type sugar transport system ATPase subunit